MIIGRVNLTVFIRVYFFVPRKNRLIFFCRLVHFLPYFHTNGYRAQTVAKLAPNLHKISLHSIEMVTIVEIDGYIVTYGFCKVGHFSIGPMFVMHQQLFKISVLFILSIVVWLGG